MRRVDIILLSLGVALHLYIVAVRSDGPFNAFAATLLAWGCLPYLVSASLPLFNRQPAVGTGALMAVLAGDAYAYYAVFIAPRSSTAPLAMLVMPLWNIVVLGPLGACVALVLARTFRSKR